jgi:hypothetical protein
MIRFQRAAPTRHSHLAYRLRERFLKLATGIESFEVRDGARSRAKKTAPNVKAHVPARLIALAVPSRLRSGGARSAASAP